MGQHHKNSSLFQLIDRESFDELVIKHGMDKGVRTFSTWEMTCALVTCMTLRLGSYRDVQASLGIPRSTFGDALDRRFHGFFQDLCDLILKDIRGRTKDRKVKRALREIMAIDSSEVRVHGSMFSTPGWKMKHTKGHRAGSKLHVIFNVDGEWIDDFKVTGVRRHDSPVSLDLRIAPNKIYVFDRAYNDLDFWLKIIDSGSHFVTRLKECKKLKSLQAIVLRKKSDQSGVLYDGTYEPSLLQMQRHREEMKSTKLRHIIYRDPDSQKIFHFVTSDLKLDPNTISAVYKRRWAVELLFRWLKGHLDIRYLAVKSSNGVKIQLAAAVLLQLLLQLQKLITHFKGTLWDILREIRAHLIRQTLSSTAFSDGCRWKRSPVNPRDKLGL